MALIVTPGQLKQRAEFYHQLSSLTSAGIGILPALQMIQANPPARGLGKVCAQLVAALIKGYTLAEAIRQMGGGWMPAFDIALVDAGEQSGRLDAVFRVLSLYYGDRALLLRNVISDLAYPVFILHFAVIIFPFPKLFLSGDIWPFVAAVARPLVPIYLLVLLLILATQSRHGETWRGLVESVAAIVPVLGSARKSLALARFSAALESLLAAGVSIVDGWELAAAASGSPRLRRSVQPLRARVFAGQAPGELIGQMGYFPDMFCGLYRTGEMSGKLDDTLQRLRNYYEEDGFRKLKAFCQWVPRIIYILIMIRIGMSIVSFYTGYYNNILNSF